MKQPSVIGIIPARMQSSRLPEKMLHPLDGKPLIQHTFEMASQAKGLSSLYVATDHPKIHALVTTLGGKALMTPPSCPNGTERTRFALEHFPDLQNSDITVIIQGDEPCVDPHCIEQIVEALMQDHEAVMATAVMPISAEEAQDPSVVKCVFSHQKRALYFSRAAIPFGHKSPCTTFHGHLGFYAFRTNFLLRDWHKLPNSRLQEIEDLEQLKVVEAGLPIAIAEVPKQVHGINTSEDIKRVEKYLCNQSICS